MSGPDDPGAPARVRAAVQRWLRAHDPGPRLCVALSGGADSLALTAAAVAAHDRVTALVVDHRLQDGSDRVAAQAAAAAESLGAAAQVLPVTVGAGGGMEAAARTARYAALDRARGGAPVLLGHTLDDQAETVLLGLARGSGARSLRAMAPWRPPWGRPLLGVRRADTVASCAALDLVPHQDPHNTDPAFTRVRLRTEVLPLLEQVLGGGVAPALARTAAQLAEDDDALTARAAELRARAETDEGLAAAVLAEEPAAVRRRVLRDWLTDAGATGLTDARLRSIDALIGRWRGQGPVAIGGGTREVRRTVARRRDTLVLGHERNR